VSYIGSEPYQGTTSVWGCIASDVYQGTTSVVPMIMAGIRGFSPCSPGRKAGDLTRTVRYGRTTAAENQE
jgi:hypothetical protein